MSPGMTMSELLDTVQASEEELRQGLRHYDCVEVEDMWYILDQDYQMMVLSRILKWVCLSTVLMLTLSLGILMKTLGNSTASTRRRL